ncbi:MAG: UPF0182 family protein [Actinobacteria bacterium]|nr:UPF0182 family protein [Actinomycetota bacterium]
MRTLFRPQVLAVVLVLLFAVLLIAFELGAEITVKTAFYDALGMGDVYRLRWRWGLLLGGMGVIATIVLALPVWLLSRKARVAMPEAPRPKRPTGPLTEEEIERLTERFSSVDINELTFEETPQPPQDESAQARRVIRQIGWVGTAVTLLLVAGVLIPSLVAARDPLLAAWNAASFGVNDPVFGRDISFFLLVEPAIRHIVQLVATATFLATAGVVATGAGIWQTQRQHGALLESRATLDRTMRYGFIMGGLFLLCMAVLLWLSRYTMLVRPGEVLAGAGEAARRIDIPTRGVAAIVLGLLSVGLMLLSITPIRRRVSVTRVGAAAIAGAGVWAATGLVLTVLASPWWLVLTIPAVAAIVLLVGRRSERWARQDIPLWAVPVFCGVSAIVLAAIGPVGALLNDAIVLRGNTLEVERGNLGNTLSATRAATGLDQAAVRRATYRPGGVTQAAIQSAPASVDSLRFLDARPAQQACQRFEAPRDYYTCDDVDLDRDIAPDGTKRTLFVMGREIDYSVSNAGEFQRRHFTYTHGYGVVTAPVNRIDKAGRPAWIARGFPQRGLTPPLKQPGIYFGARAGMPWAVVNTRSSVVDGLENVTDATWCVNEDAELCGGKGGTGIRIGGGWRRLAITKFLGGLPYIGGGRRIWNATSGGDRAIAGPDSYLLLYRDIRARLDELAPFLTQDSDPWFVPVQGRLWVVQNLYVTSGRYPYAARFNDINYVRQPAVAAVDAYSGRTYIFVTDPDEPLLKAWRKVYPELFTDGDRMDDLAPGLRAHMRYGEDLFDFQSQAAQRFHVTDVDTYFSGSAAWAYTREQSGSGLSGEETISPARYTYAVLPGETRERFVLTRSYKPIAEDRAIGFSGWLAVSNDVDDFGRMTLISFENSDEPLESLDTFTANISRDSDLTREIGQRQNAVRRGNAIVVPIGKGLLYVQPLYLESTGEPLPSLWRVVVGFGDGTVHSGATFQEALASALGAEVVNQPTSPGGRRETLAEVVARAAAQYEAYRTAFGEGRDAEAARHLAAFQKALAQAQQLAAANGATP